MNAQTATISVIVLAMIARPSCSYWQGETLSISDHPGCPGEVLVNKGLIINIMASKKNGVVLLNGTLVSSFLDCITSCCEEERCDLAVYKSDGGVSGAARNCYYVQCGQPELCRMAEDEGFMSATIVRGDKVYEIGVGREGGSAITQPMVTPTPPTEGPSNTSSTPSGLEPSTEDGDQEMPTPVETSLPTTEQTASPGTGDNETTPSPSRPSTADTLPPAVKPSASTLPSNSSSVDRPSITKVDRKKNCDEDGCEGKGVFVVVISVTLSFTVLVIVSIVGWRYIHTRRRKRKFRNVDYLINGMYT